MTAKRPSLIRCERLFQRLNKLSMDAAHALRDVYDAGAWQRKSDSFRAYCADQLGVTTGQAFKLIYAARVRDRIRDAGMKLPETVWECRNLRRKEEEGQDPVEAWRNRSHQEHPPEPDRGPDGDVCRRLRFVREELVSLSSTCPDLEDALGHVDEAIRKIMGDPSPDEIQERARRIRESKGIA